jgi:hypothetical protein
MRQPGGPYDYVCARATEGDSAAAARRGNAAGVYLDGATQYHINHAKHDYVRLRYRSERNPAGEQLHRDHLSQPQRVEQRAKRAAAGHDATDYDDHDSTVGEGKRSEGRVVSSERAEIRKEK